MMRQFASKHNSGRRLLSEPSPPDSPNRSFTDTTTPVKQPVGRYQAQADGTVKYVSNDTPSTAATTSPADSITPSPRKSGGGVGRLAASLFSSRAQVASPPASEASSSYLNWPGTQDKRGGTVAMNHDGDEDHHLASVVHHSAAAGSPMAKQRHDNDKVHRLAKPQVLYSDPWNRNHQEETMSDFSNSSSAYFQPKSKALDKVQEFGKKKSQAASVMRLTAEALAQQDHYAPPHKTMSNSVGFRGLLDKSRDVPNLIDDASSLATSMSGATSNVQPTRAAQRAPMQLQQKIS